MGDMGGNQAGMPRPRPPGARRIGYRVWARGCSGCSIRKLSAAQDVAKSQSLEYPDLLIEISRTEFWTKGAVEQDRPIERWRGGVKLTRDQFRVEGLKVTIKLAHHAAHVAKTWEELLKIEADIAEAHATIAELARRP